MKTKLLLLVVSAVAFGSCTTMYKTGQTPDDVYFSPARNYGEAVAEVKKKPANDEYYTYTGEDRMIRMGISDYRWRYLNNDYAYSPYSYYNGYNPYNSHSYYSNYGNYYNPAYSSFYNNYYYNPYYSPYPVYITPSSPIKNSTPRMTNLNAYSHNYSNTNAPLSSIPAPRPPVRSYNNSNTRTSALGNVLNKVFSPSNNNNDNNSSSNNSTNKPTTTTTERTYTPPPASSSSSSSSGSSSSGSGRITRPN